MMMQDKKIFASRWDITNDLGEWIYNEEGIDIDSVANYTAIYGAIDRFSDCVTTHIAPFWDYTNLHFLAQGYMNESLKIYQKPLSLTNIDIGKTPFVVKLDNEKISNWFDANLEDYVKSVKTDCKNKIGNLELNDLKSLGYEKKNPKYSIRIFLMALYSSYADENGINEIQLINLDTFNEEYYLPHEEILDDLARDFIFEKGNEEIANFLNYHLSTYKGEIEAFLSHLEILMDNTMTTLFIFEAKKEVLVWIKEMREKYDLALIIKELEPAPKAKTHGKEKREQRGGNRVKPLDRQKQVDIFKSEITELCNQNKGKAKIDRLNLSQITNYALSTKGLKSSRTLDRYISSSNLGQTHNEYSGQLVRQYCTDNSLNINYFN